MRAEKRDDNRRVDEDDKVGDNHERRALDFTPLHVGKALLAACEVITALEKNPRNDWEDSREAHERVGYRNGQTVGTGACVTDRVSKRHRKTTVAYPAIAVAKKRYAMLMNVTTCFLV